MLDSLLLVRVGRRPTATTATIMYVRRTLYVLFVRVRTWYIYIHPRGTHPVHTQTHNFGMFAPRTSYLSMKQKLVGGRQSTGRNAKRSKAKKAQHKHERVLYHTTSTSIYIYRARTRIYLVSCCIIEPVFFQFSFQCPFRPFRRAGGRAISVCFFQH